MATQLVNVESIGACFGSLSDPRHARNRKAWGHCISLAPGPARRGLLWGIVATEAKSNEITAIPELLKQIELANAVIMIDAMGCQKEIVRDTSSRDETDPQVLQTMRGR